MPSDTFLEKERAYCQTGFGQACGIVCLTGSAGRNSEDVVNSGQMQAGAFTTECLCICD